MSDRGSGERRSGISVLAARHDDDDDDDDCFVRIITYMKTLLCANKRVKLISKTYIIISIS